MRVVLGGKRDIRVIGVAHGNAEAMTAARRLRPDACLISATLALGEAMTLTSRVKPLT